MGRINRPNSYRHVHNTYTLNVQIPIMDLARGVYSPVHVLLSSCLAPSERFFLPRARRVRQMQARAARSPAGHGVSHCSGKSRGPYTGVGPREAGRMGSRAESLIRPLEDLIL